MNTKNDDDVHSDDGNEFSQANNSSDDDVSDDLYGHA